MSNVFLSIETYLPLLLKKNFISDWKNWWYPAVGQGRRIEPFLLAQKNINVYNGSSPGQTRLVDLFCAHRLFPSGVPGYKK